MDIDAALMTCLKAHAGLAALVADRIHFDDVPQGTPLPYVIVLDVSNPIDEDLQGPIDVEEPVKQLSAYATTRAGAKAVALQLRTAMRAWAMSGLQHARFLSSRISRETDADGLIRVTIADLEYRITHAKE